MHDFGDGELLGTSDDGVRNHRHSLFVLFSGFDVMIPARKDAVVTTVVDVRLGRVDVVPAVALLLGDSELSLVAKFDRGDFFQTVIFFGSSVFSPAGFGLLKSGCNDCVKSIAFSLCDSFLNLNFGIVPLGPGDGAPRTGATVRNSVLTLHRFTAAILGLGDVPDIATFGVLNPRRFGLAKPGCVGEVMPTITTSDDPVLTPPRIPTPDSDGEVVPTTTTSDDSELTPPGLGVVFFDEAAAENGFGTLDGDTDGADVFDDSVVTKLLISFGEAFLMSSLSLTASLHL